MQINISKNGKCYIPELAPDLVTYLDDELTYTTKQVQMMIKIGRMTTNWDGYTHLFNTNKNSFSRGLLTRVQELIHKKLPNEKITIIDYREQPHQTYHKLIKDIKLRGYQEGAIKALREKKMGIVSLPTGTGKTLVAVGAISVIPYRTLIIVHTLEILNQTVKVLGEHFGAGKVGTIQGRTLEIDKPIMVGMIQTLSIQKEYLKTFFPTIYFVIVDEAHHASSKMFSQILGWELKNTRYVLGLTGTAWREDDHDLKLEANIGEIIYHYETKDAIDDEYLVPAKVFYTTFRNHNPKDYLMMYGEAYQRFIISNVERNEEILRIALAEKDNVLIIVESIDHGAILNAIIPNSLFVQGKTKNRKEVMANFKAGKIKTLIATKIYDEGVDIPSLNALILAAGGKSATKVVQRVGRVLRLFTGKKEARIYDFMDDTKYLMAHSIKRRKVLEEKGYEIVEV